MGKYIHLFQTNEEFNQAIDNNFTEPWVSYTKENDKVDYYKTEEARKLEKPFTIEATQDGTTVYFYQSSYAIEDGLDPLKVEVSTDDGETWTEVTAAPADGNAIGATLAELDKGEKALIRGKNEAYGYRSSSEDETIENCIFYADKPCYVYGNIMSLVGGDDFVRLRKVKEYAFASLFHDYNDELNWSWVLSKEGEELLLPATALADNCYDSMFYGCTNLIAAPKLPATALSSHCYCKMFFNCKSLMAAPELPATTLADSCYNSMFSYCFNLTNAPKLPAIVLADGCYSWMFVGCSNLTVAPELPATTLTDRCYYGMFQGCHGLTTAPKLSAITLADYCYANMFGSCTGLTTAPELPVTTLMSNCYSSMFSGCTGLTVAPELPATTLEDSCYSYMFYKCTGLTSSPELPATALVTNCYSCMFDGCTNLAYIKAMFTTTPGGSYTVNWVRNVKATGTFVKNSAANWNVTGNNGVPTGWTVETADA